MRSSLLTIEEARCLIIVHLCYLEEDREYLKTILA
jgi:hypothetical protein